ncbi:MAG: glycosyltransferase family 4 protein [Bryobacteraceae bacterium]
MITATANQDHRKAGAGAFRGSVLMVGNFLSAHGVASRQVCEELAGRVAAHGGGAITTSAKLGRIERFADMVSTAWLRRHDYDVAQVDVFSGSSFLWAEAVCWTLRRAGKPYILTLHGGFLPRFFARWPRRGRALLASAARVTVPSRYLLERLVPYREDLILLPNAIDLDLYRFRQRTAPEPHLVWLRAFHRIYDPVMAPRVVALLAGEFPGIRLTMTGPAKDESFDQTRKEAQRLGVDDRIRFEGPVPKSAVPDAMQSGDIYLNTTTVDNMPVTVLEAMAGGLCVVSTNVGGVPYLIEDGVNGLLAPSGDAAAMAGAVRRLLTERGLAQSISLAGRETAGQYDWNTILPRWFDLFTSAAAENGVSS